MCSRNRSSCLRSVLVLLFGVTLLGTLLSTTALAQRLDKKTSVTFNEPVEIPGAGAQVLPAGSYVFKLFDSMSDRHIVQVFNKDETHIYATILTIPNQRLRATDKTVMTFAERAAGEPQALRAWFYPGDRFGQEFVYPKKRAVELAKVTRQPVLYVPDEVAVNFAAPVTTLTEPPVVALREVAVRAVDPAGDEVSLTQVVEPPPLQVAGLPKTAGNMALFAVMGLLSMTVGFSLRAWCAR